MVTDPSTHLFWITSRAAGTTALVFSSAAVGFGLMMGGKLVKGGGADRRSIHEILSLAVMVAIAVHGLSLIGDKYLHPSLLDVTVPFVSSYQTLWTSMGIIAGWGLIFLGLSFYLRKRIGNARWKVIHRFTLLAWAGGLVHALGEGTDAGTIWFLALVALTTLPVLALFAARVTGYRLRGPRPVTYPRVGDASPGNR
jgi:sulfoxide reductase heme-binding subunit YedZ